MGLGVTINFNPRPSADNPVKLQTKLDMFLMPKLEMIYSTDFQGVFLHQLVNACWYTVEGCNEGINFDDNNPEFG